MANDMNKPPPKHFVARGLMGLWLNMLLSHLSSALLLTSKVLLICVNRGNRGLSPSYAGDGLIGPNCPRLTLLQWANSCKYTSDL